MDEPPSYFFSDINTLNVVFSLAGIVIFILMEAFASLSEAAFFSLKNTDLERLRKSRDADELLVPQLLQKPRQLLATTRIVSAFAISSIIILVIVFALNATGWWLAYQVVISIGVVSFLVVCFGEVLPKSFARSNSLRTARSVSRFWKILIPLCKPLSVIWLKVNGLVERGFEAKGYQDTVEELNQALEMAAVDHATSDEDKEILRGIVNFGTLTVKRVMRTRSKISSASDTLNFHQLMEYVSKSGYSRIPVYRKSLDRIEGILHIKDLLPFMDKDAAFKWQDLIRPGFFVPATKKLDSLLKDFQEKHIHLAIVVNEYGGTLGLITLEDIIEEIIGDINDEFDEEELNYQKIDDTTFIFEGKASLHDFCKLTNIEPTTFDAVKGDSKSLGGLILELNRELPKTGSQINYERFTFVIDSADRKRIKRVKVIIHDQEKL